MFYGRYLVESEGKYRVACSLCNQLFDTQREWLDHAESRHELYFCIFCDRFYGTSRSYLIHDEVNECSSENFFETWNRLDDRVRGFPYRLL